MTSNQKELSSFIENMHSEEQVDVSLLTEQMRVVSIVDRKIRRKEIFDYNRYRTRVELKDERKQQEAIIISQNHRENDSNYMKPEKPIEEKDVDSNQEEFHQNFQLEPSESLIQEILNEYCQETATSTSDHPLFQPDEYQIFLDMTERTNEIIMSMVKNININNHRLIFKEDIQVLVQELDLRPLKYSKIYIKILGILACRSLEFRDYILSIGGALKIAKMVVIETKDDDWMTHAEVCWTLCTLCSGNPRPPIQEIRPIMPVFCTMIMMDKIKNQDIFLNCLYAVALFCTKSFESPVIESKLLSKLIPMCYKNSSLLYITEATLVIINKLIEGGDKNIQHLIQNNVGKLLYKCLKSTCQSIKKKACEILAEIATHENHLQTLFSYKKLYNKVVQIFNTQENDIQAELCKVMIGLSKIQCIPFFESVLEDNLFIGLENLIYSEDQLYVDICLETLQIILKKGSKCWIEGWEENTLKKKFQQLGWTKLLASLSQNYDIIARTLELADGVCKALGIYDQNMDIQ